jgi:prepilin peptidase CpaA
MFASSAAGLIWGALFTALLLAACVTDVRTRRIPNVLVLVILATGFVWSLMTRPFPESLLVSAGGLALGFAIWIVFWLVGVIGAGDVKFFAAVGVWLGPAATWRAALIAALAGGLLAAFALLRSRKLSEALRRLSLAASAGSLAVLRQDPATGDASRPHLPYGLALATGAFVMAWFPQIIP